MSGWRHVLSSLGMEVEQHFDQLKERLANRLGSSDPLLIQPYFGYGTARRLTLRGRVLEEGGRPPTDNDTVWQNLLNAYRLIESDEVPGARIRAQIGDRQDEIVTDEEGYFRLELELERPLPEDKLWHTIDLSLVDAPVDLQGDVTAAGRVLVPPMGAAFGVISDVDDTVLQTSATHYLKAARLLFLHNARTRLPFEGVAAFYHALQQGGHRHPPGVSRRDKSISSAPVLNPIFYVSSSPWNLYTLLVDFFTFQDIPLGPLFLQDYGLSENQLFTAGHHNHKLTQIDTILRTYPDLPFVLIGDSGQKDPEIYSQVVEAYPGRILAVYIRDVSLNERSQVILELAASLQGGVEMVLVSDSFEAARHAVEKGFIREAALPAILGEKKRDEAAPTTVEAILDADES